MNRGYSREWYIDRIDAIRKYMPDCTISTDIITGFCTETEEDHQETLSLMDYVKYEYAYMFKYSERPKTLAERKYEDDVPDEVKQRRLVEVIDKQQANSLKMNEKSVGEVFEVLIEGTSKRSDDQLFGRNSQNAVIIFPKGALQKGQYVHVKVVSCTAATLIGEVVNQEM
jgi:tRNA-2-methylthio-N6-dimethylallyladenosine synthase